MEDLIKAMVVVIMFVLGGSIFFGIDGFRLIGGLFYLFAALLVLIIFGTVANAIRGR